MGSDPAYVCLKVQYIALGQGLEAAVVKWSFTVDGELSQSQE